MTEGRYDERRLGDLLSVLKPAPSDWADAAKALPRARREIEEIVELAEADASYRAGVLEDLESALRERGVEPRRELIAALRARLR